MVQLTDVLQEILMLREQNKQLEVLTATTRVASHCAVFIDDTRMLQKCK